MTICYSLHGQNYRPDFYRFDNQSCEGQKVPQSPKPQKIHSNEKVAKKWLWGSTRKWRKSNEKVAHKWQKKLQKQENVTFSLLFCHFLDDPKSHFFVTFSLLWIFWGFGGTFAHHKNNQTITYWHRASLKLFQAISASKVLAVCESAKLPTAGLPTEGGPKFNCPSFACCFGIPCFFPPCEDFLLFFERCSLLFLGFWGFGRDKKSLSFWWFCWPF